MGYLMRLNFFVPVVIYDLSDNQTRTVTYTVCTAVTPTTTIIALRYAFRNDVEYKIFFTAKYL